MPPAPTQVLSSADIFNEALAVVPIVHTPVEPNQRILVVGASALAAAVMALRYPTFVEVGIVAPPSDVPIGLRQDKRIRVYATLADVPRGWIASLIVVAVPNLLEEQVAVVKTHATPASVVCFALDRVAVGRQTKELLRRYWPSVAPYREHLPTSGAVLFMLAGSGRLERQRPVPGWTRRISDRYIPAMFTFAKDEYAALFGGVA